MECLIQYLLMVRDETMKPHMETISEDNVRSSLNFSFVIPGKLAGLAHPRSIRPDSIWIDFLLKNQVHALVNLTEYSYSQEVDSQIEFLDYPVPDFGVISLEQMDSIYEKYKSMEPEKAMAVHCLAGRGRTGMVLACIAARELGMKPLDAIFFIRHLRYGSIETGEQEEFVEEWVYTRCQI